MAAPQKSSGWAQMALLAPILGWMCWVLYGAYTHQGVIGWIESVSLRLFGSSSSRIAILLAMLAGVVVVIPVAVLLSKLGVISRATVEAVARPVRASPPISATALSPEGLRRRGRSRLLLGLVIAAAGVGLGILLGSQTYASPVDAAAAPLLDLDAFSGEIPAGERVNLRGSFQARMTYGYEEKARTGSRTAHRFTPVTSRSWQRGDPLLFVLERSGESIQPLPGEVATMNVRLRRNALPTFVRAEYERVGFSFASRYWVADPSPDETLFFASLTVSFLLVLGGLAFGLSEWKRARLQARRAGVA
jgi:hypothetical protein